MISICLHTHTIVCKPNLICLRQNTFGIRRISFFLFKYQCDKSRSYFAALLKDKMTSIRAYYGCYAYMYLWLSNVCVFCDCKNVDKSLTKLPTISFDMLWNVFNVGFTLYTIYFTSRSNLWKIYESHDTGAALTASVELSSQAYKCVLLMIARANFVLHHSLYVSKSFDWLSDFPQNEFHDRCIYYHHFLRFTNSLGFVCFLDPVITTSKVHRFMFAESMLSNRHGAARIGANVTGVDELQNANSGLNHFSKLWNWSFKANTRESNYAN